MPDHYFLLQLLLSSLAHFEHHQWANIYLSELPNIHQQKKDIIVEGGGHILPFGYYRVGQLLSAPFDQKAGREIFLEQHPNYIRKVTQR